jgi:hypothetical protein
MDIGEKQIEMMQHTMHKLMGHDAVGTKKVSTIKTSCDSIRIFTFTSCAV